MADSIKFFDPYSHPDEKNGPLSDAELGIDSPKQADYMQIRKEAKDLTELANHMQTHADKFKLSTVFLEALGLVREEAETLWDLIRGDSV